MTSYEFEVAAKNAVIKVIEERFGEYYDIRNIEVVWFAHTLGYKKAILVDMGKNLRIYEATYNRDKDEMYVDSYTKQDNRVFHGHELEPEVHK